MCGVCLREGQLSCGQVLEENEACPEVSICLSFISCERFHLASACQIACLHYLAS